MKDNEKNSSGGWESASDWFNQRQNERINTSRGRYDPRNTPSPERERINRSGETKAARPADTSRRTADSGNVRSRQNKQPAANSKKGVKGSVRVAKNGGSDKSKDELRREYAEKTRKRRKRRIVEWFAFTAMIFVAIFIVLSLTVLFNIKEIEVEGDTRYTAEQIIEASGIKNGDNLWRTATSEVSKSVSTALPYIGSVSLSRKIPSTVVIIPEETSPEYAIANEKRYVLVDKSDKVLEAKAKKSGGLPVLEGLKAQQIKEGYVFEAEVPENYQAAKYIFGVCADNGIKVKKLNMKDQNDIFAVCDEKVRLDFGSATQIDEKIQMANEVMTKLREEGSLREGVINLKSTTKAFYKDGPIETTTEKPTEKTQSQTHESTDTAASDSTDAQTQDNAADVSANANLQQSEPSAN